MSGQTSNAARWDGHEATSTGLVRWDGGERTAGGVPASAAAAVMPPSHEHAGWHHHGQPGPLTGQTFADYEIGAILGEGGMGTVYRAWQRSLGRRVAVKTLSSAIGNEPLQRARFEIEARAASLIQSPHVVAVHAAGSWDGTAYFVMEFVEGSDLGALLAEQEGRGLPHQRALELTLQAARGLAAAGAKGVVHRDIKPGNLLLTSEGTVKIADFGISKIAGDHHLTRTGTTVGTPSYLAPEQGRGETTDARSDIYSLGCVMYELLTGRKPFQGENADAVIYQHNYAEPQLPRSLVPDIPEAIQAVVVRCLQKDPARRYQSADELCADIEAVRAGDVSVTALLQARYGTGAEEQMRRRLGRRHRWALPLAAALVLAALATGILIWRDSTAERRIVAQRQQEQFRDRLRSGLDALQPAPPGAEDDVATLAGLVGDGDADVRRWRGKLGAITAITSRLGDMEAGELPDATQRAAAGADLAALTLLIGGGSPAAQRAEARLVETAAEMQRLRQLLGGFDGTAETTVELRERLGPALDALGRLVEPGDADTARWRRRVAELERQLGDLRQALAALDRPGAAPDEPTLDRHAAQLEAMARLRANAPADRDELRWRTAVATHRATISRLRDRLGRLDEPGSPAETQLVALESDLVAYRPRVLPDDNRLLRWQAAAESHRRRLTDLRGRVAHLDRASTITVSRLADARNALADLRPLIGTDDADLARRERALADADGALARWREAIAVLTPESQLTLAQMQQARNALVELDKRRGLDDAAAAGAEGLLAAAERSLAELRLRCRTADETGVRISSALADDVMRYGTVMGEQDADFRRWRARIVDFVELRRRLSVLERSAPLPDAVDADLLAFARLVGEQDASLIAWRSKVLRVRTLLATLAVLDEVAPPPEHAATALDELHALVGPTPQEPAWRAKLARIDRLSAACAARLGVRQVLLADDAIILLADLEAETGSTPATAAWRQRAVILAGPPRPSWAESTVRDRHGMRAVLLLPGEPQLRLAFRHIPPGTFTIGSPLDENGRDRDELQADITLTHGRWMAETEISQAVYERIAGSDPSSQRGGDLPVHGVDWHAASVFAARFAERCGVPARLPSEAEWEHACRAGDDAAIEPQRMAWYRSTSDDACHAVGRRPPNALGLHDMLGNVWEWCSDRYGSYPPVAASDPTGGDRDERVVRGGGWADPATLVRPANRAALAPSTRSAQVGLRLVIDD